MTSVKGTFSKQNSRKIMKRRIRRKKKKHMRKMGGGLKPHGSRIKWEARAAGLLSMGRGFSVAAKKAGGQNAGHKSSGNHTGSNYPAAQQMMGSPGEEMWERKV